jgi:ribonuclease HII
MVELDACYPEYGFAKHKGYGTKQHLSALEEFGALKASKANGVQRVVKLFHYLKTRPATEIQREKEKKAVCGNVQLRGKIDARVSNRRHLGVS